MALLGRQSRWAEQVQSVLLPEHHGALPAYFRKRRWDELSKRFPELPDMSVIDLGGYARNWRDAPVRPKELVVVNLDEEQAPDDEEPWQTTVLADACDLSAAILDRGFDLVYSNSLLEHVGGYWRRVAIAKAVHRLAPHHWVQTPARYFPVEPHWMMPLFQFLPVALRAKAGRAWPLAPTWLREQSLSESLASVLEVELVSTSEMRLLYPHSEIYRERLAGLTKSIAAVC